MKKEGKRTEEKSMRNMDKKDDKKIVKNKSPMKSKKDCKY